VLGILLAVVLSYLLGGIPTAILVGKVFRGIDIREYGSGNAGATNAFRVLGWKLALPVVVVDVLKGTAAVLLVARLASLPAGQPATWVRLACGVAAVAGHVWTPYAGFRGGKGVGTAFGAMVALLPIPLLIAAGIWLVIVLVSGYVSLGSMVSAVSVPALVYLTRFRHPEGRDPVLLWTTVLLALGVLFTHRSNIRRLLAGKENRFSTPFVKWSKAQVRS